jgi:hypothetical protein
MELAITILLIVGPPSVAALASPKSDAWRRARKRYWIATAALLATGFGAFGAVMQFGVAGMFCALALNCIALGVWVYFTNDLYDKRREWREAQHVPTQRDLSKPWNF